MSLISLYTAEGTALGDRTSGKVRTADGRIEMSLGLPAELGGASADEKIINPEQLFACAWAASLADAIGFVAKQRNQILHEVSVTAAVSLVQYEADGFGVEAEFEISMPEVSESVAAELVTEARTACPYAKAWRGGQNFKLTML